MVVRQKINNFNPVAVNKKDNYCRKRTEAVEQRSHFWHFSKNYQYAVKVIYKTKMYSFFL